MVANKLESNYIFIGEGVSDNALMRKLAEKRGLPEFDYPFPDRIGDKDGKTIGGKDNFAASLKLLEPVIAMNPRAHGILIATDCGDNWQSAFDNVAEQVASTKFYPRPQAPGGPVSANGEFPHLPPLIIVMVPGKCKTGGMETLCVEALREKHVRAADCLDQYLACLKRKEVGIDDWGAEKRGKAEMQCLIAVTNRDDPNKSGQYVFSAQGRDNGPPVIDVSHRAFDALVEILEAAVKALS